MKVYISTRLASNFAVIQDLQNYYLSHLLLKEFVSLALKQLEYTPWFLT